MAREVTCYVRATLSDLGDKPRSHAAIRRAHLLEIDGRFARVRIEGHRRELRIKLGLIYADRACTQSFPIEKHPDLDRSKLLEEKRKTKKYGKGTVFVVRKFWSFYCPPAFKKFSCFDSGEILTIESVENEIVVISNGIRHSSCLSRDLERSIRSREIEEIVGKR